MTSFSVKKETEKLQNQMSEAAEAFGLKYNKWMTQTFGKNSDLQKIGS